MGRGQRSATESALAGPRAESRWPKAYWRRVPEGDEEGRLAAEVRRLVWGLEDDQPLPSDLGAMIEAGDFRLAEDDLAAARGGHEAMMFPGKDGRLHIYVDPQPRGSWGALGPELREEVSRQRIRFRVAHEVAHSFFYERDELGARRRRASGLAEEAFCDRFASNLLIPPAAVRALPATAESVLAIHRRFDVSIEVAARALADVFPTLDMALGYWPGGPRTVETLKAQWTTPGLEAKAQEAIQTAANGDRRIWTELSLAQPDWPRRQLVAVGSCRLGSKPSES